VAIVPGRRTDRNKEGKPLFEVKWEGYESKSDRTWEPEENLM
jgi:chromobox protein 1